MNVFLYPIVSKREERSKQAKNKENKQRKQAMMNDTQRLQLQNMIKTNNVEDQTELIRKLQHSHILRNEVDTMLAIKTKYCGDEELIVAECMKESQFLYTFYTDIFNKVKKNEIDIPLLYQFLDILQKIETGEVDQHEGSFQVGTILKAIYVDSALKKAEKLDNDASSSVAGEEGGSSKKEVLNISWKQFKEEKLTSVAAATATASAEAEADAEAKRLDQFNRLQNRKKQLRLQSGMTKR